MRGCVQIWILNWSFDLHCWSTCFDKIFDADMCAAVFRAAATQTDATQPPRFNSSQCCFHFPFSDWLFRSDQFCRQPILATVQNHAKLMQGTPSQTNKINVGKSSGQCSNQWIKAKKITNPFKSLSNPTFTLKAQKLQKGNFLQRNQETHSALD